VGRRWALREGIPLVTSYCTNFPDYLPGYGLGLAQGWCWRHLRGFHDAARITFCPSEATRSDLRGRGFHERMRIWSRGVDAELFNPSKRSEALRREIAPDADVLLTYVGRIAPEKKIDLLIEAFPRIRERASVSVSLLLVGGGPALERLQSLRLEGVHFAGYQRGEELAAHYASADLFVFPSDTETFGQVVTEALASGLPVVAPARGGVTDNVIPGLTGALFEPGDVDDLVAATLPLVEDAAHRRRFARDGRARAEDRSWAEIFSRLFEDYAEATSARYGAVTASPPERVGEPPTLVEE
jgi:glycosyltransferase involved in cell wall biosynthesis